MRKFLIFLFALFLLNSSLVFADAVTFKVAYFVPRAYTANPENPDDLWNIEFKNMDFAKSNFHSTSLSFSYEYFLNQQISLLIGIDTYSRKKLGTYIEYIGIIDYFEEGDFAFPFEYEKSFPGYNVININHVFNVSITPIQASLKLTPIGRRGRLIPYIGGGGGIYIWNVRLQGDYVDFDDEWEYQEDSFTEKIYGLYSGYFSEDNKISFGFHAFGGFMYPIGRRLSIDVEFKYNYAKGDLTEGFEGFEPFDLSGYQVSIGLSYWF